MVEYKGYKIFEIDFGEQDFIVAKSVTEAVKYWFSMVGDEYEEDGFTVDLVCSDFSIKSEEDGEIMMASEILKRDIDAMLSAEKEVKPYYIASSCC